MKKTFFLSIAVFLFATGFAKAQQNFRIVPSPWAMSWGLGTGVMVPQGGLGDHFNTGFALDTEVKAIYQKAFLMVNGGFSSNKLTEDISINNAVWPANSNAIHAFVGGSLGMDFEVDQFSIYPFVGIAYGFVEPNLKTANSDPVLSALKISSMVYNLGIGFDYNFPDKNYEPGAINRILKVGVRYQFQIPNYKSEIPSFDGTTHWLTARFTIGSTFPGRKVVF